MEKWIKFLQPYGVAAVCGLLMAVAWPLTEATKMVEASPIKNWTSNEYIRYSDLNNVVNHLHANLGHGHGAIITANDIASNAAIRPEQTTFGNSATRALVHAGTYEKNADGGVFYTPVNTIGSATMTVMSTATGVYFNSSTLTGTNADGGTQMLTYSVEAVDDVADIICIRQSAASIILGPALTTSMNCILASSLVAGPITYASPSIVSIVLYNNKVQ